MPETILMPKLGFDMSEGTLIRWVKSAGESVKMGDVIAEIETDKATVEVESSKEGILYKQLVNEKDIVPVGDPIAIISAPGEEVKPDSEQGFNHQVEKEDTKATIPSGKAQKKADKKTSQETDAGGKKVVSMEKQITASPLAKRMAAESNININEIKGSGPYGRVVKRDVDKAIEQLKELKQSAQKPVEITKAKDFSDKLLYKDLEPKKDTKIPLTKLRSIIGNRMTESKQTIPQFYITHKYNVDNLVQLRENLIKLSPDENPISINDFVVKAIALSLRQFPNLNASLEEDQIIQHGHINIGVAVALEDGLLTVVCKDADQKPLKLISEEIRDMVSRVRAKKVKSDDIEGSTFSISNLGMFDVEQFVAIINPPEAAILAVGAAQKETIIHDDLISISTVMRVTLSADHRITDGAETAKFLQLMGRYFENPLSLVL